MSSSRSRRRGAGSKALVLIDRTLGTNIGDMTGSGGLAGAFNGTTSQATGGCAQGINGGYVGKTLTGPKVFGQAVVYGSNDHGFVSFVNPSLTLNIRGKNGSAPSSRTDGTIVGTSGSITDTANESAGRTINSTDLVNTWDHLWVELTSGSGGSFYVGELVLYEWA